MANGIVKSQREIRWYHATTPRVLFLTVLVQFLLWIGYLNLRVAKDVWVTHSTGSVPPFARSISAPTASLSMHQSQSRSICSFWWPSPEINGGFLGVIHRMQNPVSCSARTTKYFVWRSREHSENDTRGLTAWATAGMMHLMHAHSDGDSLKDGKGGRVLETDDELWPMAKGCPNGGPETRECYFEPLSKCGMSHVDSTDSASALVLDKISSDYDRSIRTIYTPRQEFWFRLTDNKFAFADMGWGKKDQSELSVMTAALAYYLRPQPWLRDEIDQRLRKSIPSDLNPDRTIGMPIRRSDKCHGHNIEGSAKGEQDCPTFETYLDAVKTFLKFDPLINTIIITSEDAAACDEFIKLVRTSLPKLRIVTNTGDVQQGTGSGNKINAYVAGVSNADVVASALTSMHLQIRARYLVLTTKSSWSSSIAILARAYGFATEISTIDVGRNGNAVSQLARSGSA